MKLYTEEQVIELLEHHSVIPKIWIKHYLNELKPVQLPSDDEITDKALEIGYTNNLFTLGAKWMRDKIQGGNK